MRSKQNSKGQKEERIKCTSVNVERSGRHRERSRGEEPMEGEMVSRGGED